LRSASSLSQVLGSGKTGVRIKFLSTLIDYRSQFSVNIARRFDPSLPVGHPEVVPKSESEYPIRYDTSKAARILKMAPRSAQTTQNAEAGIRYHRTMEEVTKDLLDYIKTKGW
jgi:hypothetical protein